MVSTPLDPVPLPLVSRELMAITGQPGPSYRQVYVAVLGCRFPAEWERGRWRVRREHLPLVAEALGVTRVPRPPDRRSPKSRTRPRSATHV
jgi:hypothetical protein